MNESSMDENESNDKNKNNSGAGGGGSSSSSGSCRWNPTKEQIGMLENLYKQGIRTPSAEQIQQITARLRAYGHIEGKNVFYWFQNHKARQRQKHKQETLAYFNRFPPPPILSSPNVLCAPYYLPVPVPQCNMGFYPQHHNNLVLPPGSSSIMRSMPTRLNYDDGFHQLLQHQQSQDRLSSPPILFTFPDNNNNNDDANILRNDYSTSDKETLPLFPLQPTGILQDKTPTHFADTHDDISHSSHASLFHEHHVSPFTNQPFFDFLSSSSGHQDFVSERSVIGKNTN